MKPLKRVKAKGVDLKLLEVRLFVLMVLVTRCLAQRQSKFSHALTDWNPEVTFQGSYPSLSTLCLLQVTETAGGQRGEQSKGVPSSSVHCQVELQEISKSWSVLRFLMEEACNISELLYPTSKRSFSDISWFPP